MHHDSDRFPDPDVFDPDHYKGITALASELAQSVNPDDRDHYGYGAGRRLCPGIHLAERNLFLAIAKLLWAFDFKPAKDAQGKDIIPDTSPTSGYSEGFLVCAKNYELDVKVRSDKRKDTILREYEAAKTDYFAKFDVES